MQSSTSSSLMRLVVVFISIVMMPKTVNSHSVEVRSCLSTGGKLRVFVEHWHGDLEDPAEAGTMTIRDEQATGTSAVVSSYPAGVVNNAANRTNLPGCANEYSEVQGECGIRAFDDWIYYDFDTVCNVPVSYTFLEGDAVWLIDGCEENGLSPLFPATIVGTFTDSAAPVAYLDGEEISNDDGDERVIYATTEDLETTTTIVNFTLTATDDCDAAPSVTASPESGSSFGLGNTTVTVTTLDNTGREKTVTFTVCVVSGTSKPSLAPSLNPSLIPTSQPSLLPSTEPAALPSAIPTLKASAKPSSFPSEGPSLKPSLEPSMRPTDVPSFQPSLHPSLIPSVQPSLKPSLKPSVGPTDAPTLRPSLRPSLTPSVQPSSKPSLKPSVGPTNVPTLRPSHSPSLAPSKQSQYPSLNPSMNPTLSSYPSAIPTGRPSISQRPSINPSSVPSIAPTISNHPSQTPTSAPSISSRPSVSNAPSYAPSSVPSISSRPSGKPTTVPTTTPTDTPSDVPSISPSDAPSDKPSKAPSDRPSVLPSEGPTDLESRLPSNEPSESPSNYPSISSLPSPSPSHRPSVQPSNAPTKTCRDNPDSFGASGKVTCKDVRRSTRYRNKMCSRARVQEECPQTCGVCCQDDPDYRFDYRKEIDRDCAWISELPKFKKKKKVCNSGGDSLKMSCQASCAPVVQNWCLEPVTPRKATKEQKEKDKIEKARQKEERLGQ